ncbi:hypothetical protein [Stenotrophomonas maltophilia]
MAKLYFYYWCKSLFGGVNNVRFLAHFQIARVSSRQDLFERDTVA